MRRKLYIIVVGPDGCGKTTLVERLVNLFSTDHLVKTMIFSFGILPSLSTISGRQPRKLHIPGERNSGMVRPLNMTKALVLACWYGVDHVLGHIKIRKNDEPCVMLFARSYHDFLYQRAYINLPKIVPKFFLLLGPQPDFIFVPVRSAKEINLIKPELDCEEIQNQYYRIIDGLEHTVNFHKIDASKGVDATVKKMMEIIGSTRQQKQISNRKEK